MLYTASTIVQLVTIFVAVLSGAIAIRLVFATQGGLASKAIKNISYGITSILLALIISSFAAAADILHPFSDNIVILITNILFAIGFIFILIGEYILFKELS